ncbi:hypothetical protein ACTHQ2_22735, partial [Bacillus subtilis]|uniref:hypothetical protein n=1 Tax=Bacillus subtilis TaxID=1423 RepID=UPI003F7C910D
TGLLGLLVILSAWGFLVTASKLSKSERNLRQKISKRDVFGSALNFTFLFLGVKYLYPGMHGAFYFILIALVLGEFFRIPLLRRYQRHYGPLDVERFQKKTARRTRKQEEANHFKNGPKKKKHGRQ